MDPKKDKEPEDERAATAAAVEVAENAKWGNRMLMQIGQKLGTVEQTKLEPRFDRNIEKLIVYHNIIYRMVDAIELQLQVNPKLLAKKKVSAEPGQNPWEILGGWMYYLSTHQYTGAHANIMQKYSQACTKVCAKETLVQKRTRSNLIRNMRIYIGEDSDNLNQCVADLKVLLHSMDEARHQLKSAQTTAVLNEKGAIYQKFVNAFNHTANEIQASIDEVPTLATIHQRELLKFARETSVFHDSAFNALNEVILRFGYRHPAKK